ncbi:Maf family protein [Kineothrix sp. MB12-C1]|uniref:Maf family protein n=1 Tax=Kineothrix sp. MB12-C1 TaxID=3070215 RepID=UPI0027D30A81|nr:Maf family protein [Kineothrix sp. MB12-C1]WMC92155.1 Maf family protein [Kineothrix sp. MB12-C1]
MNKIILASASPRRRELLSQIGVTYEVIPSTKEEKTTKVLPQEIVQELSLQKAEDIAGQLLDKENEDFIVIGADTVVAFQNVIMGKPKSEEDAKDMLRQLQGNVHQVYTGVTIAERNQGEQPAFYTLSVSGRGMFSAHSLCSAQYNIVKYYTFFERTDVTMYPMTEDEISAYVATGEPMDKAGSYGIQGICAAYIQSICGDYNNVVGLPVGRLYQEMKQRNIVTIHQV